MRLFDQLPYPADTRLLMIHADDAGLAHGENRATKEVLQNGLANSYSIMVPCPWFGEMANFAKAHPEYDYGIHLTLTCEWHQYRFGPLSSAAEVPGLVDKYGHFYKKRHQLVAKATAAEVEKELRAQIDYALDYGLQPSHLDSHMFSLGADPAFLEVYRKLGRNYQLPICLNGQLLEMVGQDLSCLQAEDPLLDQVFMGDWELFQTGTMADYYFEVLDQLKPGLSILFIHPAYDNAEMRAVCIDHPNFGAEWRQIDLDTFTSTAFREKLAASDIQLINWREIREAMYGEEQ
ncbi:MAG TPA: polysaccharide deacetylase family protein [Saprospiraceae bacterium]|nr:polysaccharide deacetylase family protein [Saprospiraceae bacterium]